MDRLNQKHLKFRKHSIDKSLTEGSVFNLRFVDFFYPGYAYGQVENTGMLHQIAYGYVLKKRDNWEVIDAFEFDDWTQELDRKSYIENRISTNKTNNKGSFEP